MAGRTFDTVQAVVPDEPVAEIIDAHAMPPWRHVGGPLFATVLLATLWQTSLSAFAAVIAVGVGALASALFPTRRILGRTSGRVIVVRPDTLLRPGTDPTLVASADLRAIERTRVGVLSDRWQIGSESVLVPRWTRRRVAEWRAKRPS